LIVVLETDKAKGVMHYQPLVAAQQQQPPGGENNLLSHAAQLPTCSDNEQILTP